MSVHYALVAQRARHRCEYCRAPESIFNFPFEVEHIIPVTRQGSREDVNLALACRACNLHKSDHLTGEIDGSMEPVLLFHPRRDKWEEHFQIDLESGAIQGVTRVARGTVVRLRFNSESQVLARRFWIQLGLFP
jgi:hypothetical protein